MTIKINIALEIFHVITLMRMTSKKLFDCHINNYPSERSGSPFKLMMTFTERGTKQEELDRK